MKFIEAMHLYKSKDGGLYIRNNKKYFWVIPENLEKENISQGDIVLALCKNTKAPVLVLNVFEKDKGKTNHKKVIKILNRTINKKCLY